MYMLNNRDNKVLLLENLLNFTKVDQMKKMNFNQRHIEPSKNNDSEQATIYEKLQSQMSTGKQGKLRKVLLSRMIKHPLLILGITMLVVILLLPTTIVLFTMENTNSQTITENQDSFEPLTSIDPTLEVSIQRTATEEIEHVPLETYVARVVASEMPAEFSLEALKAQSVAARTYVINYMLLNETDESVISDHVEHQVYKNDDELREQWAEDYHWKMDKIIQAVHETEGEILTYNESLITPVYFSTSNGFTENSEEYWQNEIPYLRSVESPWDKQSPKYKKQITFSFAEIENALDINLSSGIHTPISITKTTGQRVKDLSINGTNFTGREIREKLQLPSSDFTIEQKNNHLLFTTRGYGHGVGMSQYGAQGMAEEGQSYRDIITHYYQDVSIDSVDQYVRTLALDD